MKLGLLYFNIHFLPYPGQPGSQLIGRELGVLLLLLLALDVLAVEEDGRVRRGRVGGRCRWTGRLEGAR